MSEPERWTILDFAAEYNYASRQSASSALHRAGVKPVSYQRGPSGQPQALYDPGQVRDAMAARPGRGTGGGRPPGRSDD